MTETVPQPDNDDAKAGRRSERWLRVGACVVVVALTVVVGVSWLVEASRPHNTSLRYPDLDARLTGTDAPHRWIAFGGGPVPSNNQIAIEADLLQAREVLGGRGHVLFSGGNEARCVQVLAPRMKEDGVRRELAAMFWPRAGREAIYRRTRITDALPATRDNVLAAIEQQLALKTDLPLLVYVSGHGELASRRGDNAVQLWAGGRITPVDLAGLFERARPQRTTQLVMTTCYSGAFADVIFDNGNERTGRVRTNRCGLFAAPWDLESSGCDPDPDRRRHEGYTRYFMAALQGRNRDGAPLRNEEIDFDGDGVVSLLEAHTRVRIASTAPDVPTSTSERLLRVRAPSQGAMAPFAMPAETAVIQAMAIRLRVTDPAAQAARLFERYERRVDDVDLEFRAIKREEDTAYHKAAADLLAKWPVLDDPWHRDFPSTLRDHSTAIEDHLGRSETWHDYQRATRVTESAGRLLERARLASAYAERLARAVETRLFAARLRARGGSSWRAWRALRRCEAGLDEAVPLTTKRRAGR